MAKITTGMQLLKVKTTAALKTAINNDGKAEYRLHCQVVELLQRSAVDGLRFWHTPNGGKRNVREAVKLKAMGTKRGISDLILSWRDGRMAYIELKSPKGKLELDQEIFLSDMKLAGHATCVAKSFDECVDFLNAQGAIKTIKTLRRAA